MTTWVTGSGKVTEGETGGHCESKTNEVVRGQIFHEKDFLKF